MFSVGPGGVLTPVSGSPFATGAFANSVAFSPSGGLLATANTDDNTVSVFSVASDGALTQVSGSPFGAGSAPISVAFSPSGGLLATANAGDNTVSVFSVASDGALTQVSRSPSATGNGPDSLAFSPGGALLAVTNFGLGGDPPSLENTVSVFSVASDGALTPVSGSPFTTGNGPGSVAFSPSGRLLATANTGAIGAPGFTGNTVSVFSVTSGGALTQVSGSPFTTGNAPSRWRSVPVGCSQPPTSTTTRCRSSRRGRRRRRSLRRRQARSTRWPAGGDELLVLGRLRPRDL